MRASRVVFSQAAAFTWLCLWVFRAADAQAQELTPRALFESHNLLGIFGWDCSKPPSKQNHYFIHRPLDPDHVQRDMMEGPSTRGFVAIIDKAARLKSNEIFVGGRCDGKLFTSVYRIEANRMLVLDSMLDGKAVVSGGRLTTGGQIPWAHRCSGL